MLWSLVVLPLALAASTPPFSFLGPDPICGSPVPGHTVLCFDPHVPVALSTMPAGMRMSVVEGVMRVTDGDNRTLWALAHNGSVVVGDGIPFGAARSISVGLAAIVPVDDGAFIVRKRMYFVPGGAIEDVMLTGAAMTGWRLVTSGGAAVTVLADGTVVAGNATTGDILAGLDGKHRVIAATSVFTSSVQSVQTVSTSEWADRADGSVYLIISAFGGTSRCGSFRTRQRQRTIVPEGACMYRTPQTDTVLGTTVQWAYYQIQCPQPGSPLVTVNRFIDTGCATPPEVTTLPLGQCLLNNTYVLECDAAI